MACVREAAADDYFHIRYAIVKLKQSGLRAGKAGGMNDC